MAGHGAGPSRRSHTKSRKGCKTCKRRHIRCDETFPQCRNCTKHQVRCDYMESVGTETDSQHSPEQQSLLLTPNSENLVETWQQTGTFPYPDLQVYPPPQIHEYSKNDLRLLHHLSSVSNSLLLKRTSHATIWAQKMPKFLSLASTHPYVMEALLSFSANHLAWSQESQETRDLHIQHGSVALRGLHEAIGNFSHANADAVLAASLLMLWQATDWMTWSSLRSGIQSVVATMQSWKQESLFAGYISEEGLLNNAFLSQQRRPPTNNTERSIILQNTMHALQTLQMALVGQQSELRWVNQLLSYIQRLQTMSPPQSPEEQFHQLYVLRKWLFWVPISLLQSQGGQGPAMLTVAHFYSTALALEPLFPELGSSFCAAMSLAPLESILRVTDAMQTEHALDPSSIEIASLMQFPHQIVHNFKSRTLQTQPGALHHLTAMSSALPVDLGYTSIGNLSPAFAASPLHYDPHQSVSTSHSPFLEVPVPNAGFSYGTQSWGIPSPGFPSPAYTPQDEQMYGYMPAGGFRGGTPVDYNAPGAGPSQPRYPGSH